MAVQAQLYPESLGLPTFVPGLQDWIVYNPTVPGNGVDVFSNFEDQNLFFSQEISPPFGVDNNTGVVCSSSTSTCDSSSIAMALSQALDPHFRMQREELDCFLQLQNERLRLALQEQRKLQLETLLKSAESKAWSLMRQKEDNLAEARRKTLELEARLGKAQMDSDSWQRLARTNESLVLELTQQVKERLLLMSEIGRSQDAESCCGSCDRAQEDTHTQVGSEIACKSCNSRRPNVLFLPCRHLSSCMSCEAFLGSCPVCKSVKEASMEVFWS
ncbi:hypothetical protein K2173_007534 [Erythroxylum novogranatense]|uniref:RING-type domain-containing protein n=1 Tax=Erythroxylum novogranatense TaxID=1862640 RepID=A0AAV8T7K6_9ROSI|nr:hypothetical protein K2173_007534 [Erythroxylum novogranatense]